jgi:hypothetical protein
MQNGTSVPCTRLTNRLMLAKMKSRGLLETYGLAESSLTLERRRETRVRVDIAARLKCLNPLTSTGPSARARIIEISYHGMKLRMNRELLPGGLVQIIVSNQVLMGTVRYARRTENEFEVGIRLTERIPSCLEQS